MKRCLLTQNENGHDAQEKLIQIEQNELIVLSESFNQSAGVLHIDVFKKNLSC